MSMPAPHIKLTDVTVTRPDGRGAVAEHVDWSIAAGEFWVVAGDQGSGKTALLETAAGLLRPAAGTVRLFGGDVAPAEEQQHLEWRQRIGFVAENGGGLLSHLSLAGNILLPLLYHGVLEEPAANERAAELLEGAGLTTVAGARPSHVSPAVQQRVAWLRAVASPKDVVFVDHPVGPRWWRTAVAKLQAEAESRKRPLAMVVAAADFRGWRDLASSFALLHDGRLQVFGSREQLLASGHELVQELK